MKSLLVLGGGRPQPAILTTYWVQPRAISLALPEGSHDGLSPLFRELFPGLIAHSTLRLPQGDPVRARELLLEVLGREEGVSVSLTGTPLPLALAAIDACRKLGRDAYYLDTAAGRILNLARPEESRRLRFSVAMQDFLAACGAREVPTGGAPLPPRRLAACARLFLQAGRVADRLMASLRRARVGLDFGVPWECSLRRWELDLVGELARSGLLTLNHLAGGVASVTIQRTEWRILDGGWLEDHAERSALGAVDRDGQRVFSEVRSGVRLLIQQAERELDLVALRGATPLVASCKTAGKLNKGFLDELNAVARSLGQEYCPRLMIHSSFPTGLPWEPYLKQAAQLGVVVVTGDQLQALPKILATQILSPTFGRR